MATLFACPHVKCQAPLESPVAFDADSGSTAFRRWTRLPSTQLIGVGILALMTAVRLGVTTYMSWPVRELPAVRLRLAVSWLASLVVLALLSRFARQAIKKQRLELKGRK
jgi:hypothetical protein